MNRSIVLFAAVLVAACTKSENITPSSETTSSATPVPVASSQAAPEPAPTPPETASAAASASATPRPTATTVASAPPPKPTTTTTRIEGNNFAIDVAVPPCKADTECVMTLKLVAAGDFHVNKEYPYKFLATPAPNVTFLGKDDPNTFSKASGDYKEEGEKTATMTVRFKPSSAGNASVAGTYKLSVCNADQCQIEQQKVALGVPVL